MTENKNIVPADKDSIHEKLLSAIKGKSGGIFAWMQTEDGKTISSTVASLASFVTGDPSGMIFPILIQATDISIRRRLLKHWPDLAKRLNEQQNRMDEKFYKSEFGQKLLKDTLSDIIQELDEQKIEYHKQFLLNAYKNTQNGNELIQAYRDLLRSLDSVQLRTLGILYQPVDAVKAIFEKLKGNGGETTNFALKQNLSFVLGIDRLLFDTVAIKLEASNLISTKGRTTNWCEGNYRTDGLQEGIGRMSSDAHQLLTDYGINFIKFVICDQ